MKNRPTFLIIGAQKAATTWLAGNIATHPDVFVAPAKELYFFNHEFERGLDWYGNHFAEHAGESAIGEATPGYLPHPDAPARIAATLDSPQLIALLRQPVDRGFSAFWHHLRSSRIEPGTDFASYLENDVDEFEIRERGMYSEQLARYFDHFDRHQLKIMLYDDLFVDSQATVSEVLEFIGVDPAFVPPSLDEQMNKGSRSVGVLGGPAQKLREVVTPAIDRMPKSIREPILGAGRRAFEKVAFDLGPAKATFEPLDPTVRLELTERFYSNEIDALEQLLDRDLSSWRG